MKRKLLRIAMAQLNIRVGDIHGNTEKMINAAVLARERDGADIVVMPELALVGYPPDDFLLRRGLPTAVKAALMHLTHNLVGITAIIGYPEYARGNIYNAAVVVRDGQRIAQYRKQCLPNYGVFDERRHFQQGRAACVFEHDGHKVGVTICEDLWQCGPIDQAAAAGASVVVNLNASPFQIDKQARREVLLSRLARANRVTICYVNSVGGEDELVFDGCSCAVNNNGRLIFRAPEFEIGVYSVDCCEMAENTLLIDELPSPEASVYDALVLAIRDYVENNGFPGVLIGLSGGIDSALTLALAVDALGGECVWAVSMPSRYSADISQTDAADQARRMGARFSTLSIEDGFSGLLDTLDTVFEGGQSDAAEENLQARVRGSLLMALSNKYGYLVLATGNKSEMAVGYTTLYGDMCGGFAPLKDVYKSWVYRLANFRNTRGQVIPARVIIRPPTAELRPGQLDTDSLPEYGVLDAIIRAYVEDDASIGQICHQGFDETVVRHVVSLIQRSEFKRRQAAPGPKITRRAFGRDRRYPITIVYDDV